MRLEAGDTRGEWAQVRGALGSLESFLTAHGDQALLAEGNREEESPTVTANSTPRLIIRAVWREDGNITSVPGASITLGVMYTS